MLYNRGTFPMDQRRNPIEILLAEDNPADVRLIREALTIHNIDYSLHVVNDGEKALGFLGALGKESPIRIGLILLDLNLPKSDGRDILRAIKQSPEVCEVPVLVLSSSDSPVDRAETASLGASRYIRKPLTLDEFLAIGAIAKEFVAPAA